MQPDAFPPSSNHNLAESAFLNDNLAAGTVGEDSAERVLGQILILCAPCCRLILEVSYREESARMRSKNSPEEFEAMLAKCRRLEEENDRLRRALLEHGIPLPPQRAGIPSASPTESGSGSGTVNHHSSPEAKIALFRSLFRGR